MVDQLLAELGGEPLPVPTSPCERSVVDRVTHALELVESLGTDDLQATEMGRRLRDKLRSELRSLLRELPEETAETTSDAPRCVRHPAPSSRPTRI